MKTLVRFRGVIWAFLQSLGPWGVVLMAAMDGAAVPLPGALDAVVAAYVYNDPAKTWGYIFMAAGGSALGSLVLFYIGRAGGEMLIEKRMTRRKFEKVRDDFERHPVVAVALPSMLPPPFPFKIVVLSAGAFNMRCTHFLMALFLGRVVRFAVLSLLTIMFGPQIVTLISSGFRRHPLVVVAVIAAVVIVLVLFARNGRLKAAEPGR